MSYSVYIRCAFFFIVALLIASCRSESELPSPPSTTTFEGVAMTIPYKIILGGDLDPFHVENVNKVILEAFEEINSVYNNDNPESEISRLNQLPADVKVEISPEMENFLTFIDHLYEVSKGNFDPTLAPLHTLWKKYLEKGSNPPEEEIGLIAPAVGWHHIHLKKGMFKKDHDLTQIDLIGIVKGLCVDLLVERIAAEGYPHVLVEWGGELRAMGQHPDEKEWKVSVNKAGDRKVNQPLAILNLRDQALATVEHDKQVVTDLSILDPLTTKPLGTAKEYVTSVSVLASTCTWAEGLANAALQFSTAEEARQWIEEIQQDDPDLTFWLVTSEE